MKPEDVPNTYFEVTKIIYDNGDFAVAFGYYDGDENVPRLAMRWNGGANEKGFPLLKDHTPTWFHLPNDGIWFSEMIGAVDKITRFEQAMKIDCGFAGRLQLNSR